MALAQQVTDRLSGGEELRPYRALWFYLAAAWAQQLAAKTRDAAQLATAQTLLREAVGCARTTRWHPALPGLAATAEPEGRPDPDRRATKAAATLRDLGIRGARFALRTSEIEEQIGNNESGQFEEGLRGLGEMLGFDAVRPKGQANPDGVWRDGETIWLIFETKTEEQADAQLSVDTVRQSASHHRWVTTSMGWSEAQQTLTVIISPREAIDPNAAKLAADQALVTADVIRDIARRCMTAHSEVRALARGLGNEALAANLASRFDRERLDTLSLLTELGARRIGLS